MTEISSIAKLCLDCQSRFMILISVLRSGKKANAVSSIAIENEFARFKLWAANIGAMHQRGSKASLECRLEGAGYLYQNVMSLLQDILEILTEGFSLHSFSRLTESNGRC